MHTRWVGSRIARQRFDSFAEQRLQAAMDHALGNRAEQPDVTERQLHTFYTG